MRTDSASLSMRGDRPVNEDSILCVRNGQDQLFVLCDGLGGHLCGDEASTLVCSEMRKQFLLDGIPDPERKLRHCIDRSQEALLEAQKRDSRHSGMRTTMCSVFISGSTVRAAYIGDSRIYHFRRGKLLRRTLDHSVPQMLVRMGELREEDIRGNENRNRLLRAMGMPWEIPQYDMWDSVHDAAAGDAFLLCSDGFWEWILEGNMEKILQKTENSSQWLSEMERVVRKAGKNQVMDNYSAIAVRFV